MYVVAFGTASSPPSCTRSPTCCSARRRTRVGSGNERWGAVRELVRSSRTSADSICGPRATAVRPAMYWDQSGPRPSLWQLTTRPPRAANGRSGSQLPVESRGCDVRAGGADGGEVRLHQVVGLG